MKLRWSALVLSIALALNLLSPTFSAVAPKPGTKCSKQGKVQVSKNYEYSCIKKSGKLVWSKGVLVKKQGSNTATPIPTPTPSTSSTPTPSPTVSATKPEALTFENPCAKDPLVPAEWRDMEAYMFSIGACSAALRIVEKSMPDALPKLQSTSLASMLDLSICKLVNKKPQGSYLGFPDPNNKQAVSTFLERRHPSSDTTFQIIPISALDAPAGSTTPIQDYKKYFDYVKNWIEYNSDFGSSVQFKVPDRYFYIPVKVGDYQLEHSPANLDAARVKRKEFMTKVIEVVDKEIDFREADISIVVVPAGTSLDVIQQTVTGWVMSDEGPVDRITAVAPDTTTLGKKRPLANLNHPIWWIHEFYHVGLGLDDHYGDQRWNYGTHGTGHWTLMSTGQTELSTWEKWLVGLLEDSQVRCAKSTESSLHWLAPTTYRTQKEKLLVIPISTTKAVVVESMRIGGLNYKIPKESEGALVYLLDMNQIDHGYGMELKVPDSRNLPSQISRYPFFMSNAPFKLNESIVIEGVRITVVESGSFGDVIKVEKV